MKVTERNKKSGFRKMLIGRMKRPYIPAYDNEPPPPTPPKTFTQEQVNAMLAADRRENEAKQKKKIEELLAAKTTTEEEKAEYEKKLNELRDSVSSQEEIAKRNLEETQKKAKLEQENLIRERDSWKTRYADSTIRRSITDAAVEHKAFNPKQIVDLLVSNTQLVEAVDEKTGKPTGEFIPQVTLDTLNGEKKPVKLKLSPSEAVKHMRGMADQYGNLFEGGVNGGFGGGGSRGGGGTGSAPKGDQAAYRMHRDQRLGITRK